MGKIFFKTLAPGLFIFLQSCGGSANQSEKVLVIQLPEVPVVIKSPFTVIEGGEEKTYQGPWFSVKIAGKNDADKTVSIVSFFMDIETRTEEGEINTTSFTPEFDSPVLYRVPPGEVFGGLVDWYVTGLPKGKSSVYNVKVTLEGWFNKSDNPDTEFDESVEPESNFRTSFRFRTQ